MFCQVPVCHLNVFGNFLFFTVLCVRQGFDVDISEQFFIQSSLPRQNLNRLSNSQFFNQRKALRELKADDEVKIYPFDKGAGMVRITKTNAIEKINEQIGNTEIIKKDPTTTLARKFQTTLRRPRN